MLIDELVGFSNFYGSDPSLVLAGGGNTSAKADGRMWVKGSGTALATITAQGFVEIDLSKLSEIFEKVSERARELCSGLSVHDMRIVPGSTHTNIIFDLVIPASLFKNKDFYASELTKTVSEIDENYFAVITSEISYC